MAKSRSGSRSTRCEHLAMWLRDVRIAMRRLGRSPGFASASILTLALGTGAAGAVFSLVNAVLLRPLPWRQPATVALIWPVQPSGERTWLSFPELEDLRREGANLAVVAGLTDLRPTFIADGIGYELQAVAVSHDLFRLLGVAPVLGRDFSRSDDQRGGAAVAILSDSFWRARFGADPTIVGRSIVLDARPCVVIGVLPPAFGILPPSSVLPDRVDVWLPLEQHLASRDRGVRFLHVLARVHGKADFSQAREELRRYAARARRQFASAYPGGVWQFTIVPFAEDVLKEARMSLRLLLALVGLVLLMACANVANLFLARGEARGTELAIRTALGASPARLAGELMAEALVLAACGSALGLALAAAAPAVLRAVDPGALPRLEDASVDGRVVAFMPAVALLTAAIFASVPFLERLRLRSLVVFGSARSGGRTRRSAAAGRLLVLTQTALATTIIVLALFLTVTFNRLQRTDLGFSRDHVLTARVSLSPPYSGGAAATRFFDPALEAATRVPGVVKAAAVTQLPLSGAMLGSTFLVGQGGADSPRIDADLRGITPQYLDVMGIPLVSGRAFDATDSAGSAPVAIVDESFARRMPGGGPVVGRRIRWLRQPDVEVEIVGVARAVRHRGAGIVPRETVYRPHWQYARASMYLAVRTRQDASGAASALRAAVASVDPSQPVADVATMSHRFERSISRSRTSVMLAGVLAGLALALALVGLYGVLSLGVAHRVLEFGVRMALGATPGAVQRLVLGEGLLLTAVGASAGAATAAMVRLFPGLWSGAGWSDVYTYVSGICLVMVCAAVAFWFPARQAGAIEPMVILKGD